MVGLSRAKRRGALRNDLCLPRCLPCLSKLVVLVFVSGLLAACTAASGERDAPVPSASMSPALTAAEASSPLIKETSRHGALRASVPRAASSLVVDVKSGAVLYQAAADGPRYPASLTKLMTLYVIFEEVKAGRLSLLTPMTVSANAASKPAARLGLKAGDRITVRAAISALIVKSANDVATVVAEHLAGSEAAFVGRMNQTAMTLGLGSTRFVNASGLPGPGQVTTARDMAHLARIIRLRHGSFKSFFAARLFQYKGRTYQSTNQLLGRVYGVTGMKTGYIRQSGYHLVASVQRRGREALVIVFGGASANARDAQVEALIDTHL